MDVPAGICSYEAFSIIMFCISLSRWLLKAFSFLTWSSFFWKSPNVVFYMLNLADRRDVVEVFIEVSKLAPLTLLMLLGQNKVISNLFSLRQLCGVVT